MTSRIHIVVGDDDKERFHARARREGKSLSEWIRDAAREKLRTESVRRFSTLEELQEFFAECDAREQGRGREPDWEEHRRVIEESIRSGASDT